MKTLIAQTIKTVTETRNFHEVTVSTVIFTNGNVQTIVFYNTVELWCNELLKDATKSHKTGVLVAEKYNLIQGDKINFATPYLNN